MSRRQMGGETDTQKWWGMTTMAWGTHLWGQKETHTGGGGVTPAAGCEGRHPPWGMGMERPLCAPASRPRERHVHCRRWTPRGGRGMHTRSGDGWLQPRAGEEDEQRRREVAQDTRVCTLRAHTTGGEADMSRGTHRPPLHLLCLCPPPGLG